MIFFSNQLFTTIDHIEVVFYKSEVLQRDFQESLQNTISIVFPPVLVQPQSYHLDEQVQIHYSLVIDDLYHQ